MITKEDIFKIKDFIETSEGLSLGFVGRENTLLIKQEIDKKSLIIEEIDLEGVLCREDTLGKTFLQLNFINKKKILLTQSLVGFKPVVLSDLDMRKLPKVVSTSDLTSIIEAIEESISSGETPDDDIQTLKRMFASVLEGGQAMGLDLSSEKTWLQRLVYVPSKWA